MTFSSQTRNELARVIPSARCCRIAELSALYDLDGFLLGRQNQYLDFNSSLPLVARKTWLLLKGLYPDLPVQVLLVKSRSRRSQVCTVRVLGKEAAALVYRDLKGQEVVDESGVPRKKCCRRAYLRGAFLNRGSVTNPEKTYHLEIVTEQTAAAERIFHTMVSLDLEAGLIQRQGSWVVYLKEGQLIVNLLNLMGAHSALLSFENVRVMKDMRNRINRLVNCETANVDKTVKAALDQIEDIERIDAELGLENLPGKLQDVARARLANPYASLQELGNSLSPKLSKSGVNYRLRQLKKIAQELDGLDHNF
ncbi:MAG: DNA-binding protein WhiA [Firmicutes bacterium]|jgi:DNA-binding protein WhiA|nr:DNA-binding protein WhiA [Bacillota bacterium]NLO65969.1 DNA-binding protein WhiA [Bacillota bacterium]